MAVAVLVAVRVKVLVRVPVAVRVKVLVRVPVAVPVAVRVKVLVRVKVAVCVLVCVRVLVAVRVLLRVIVPVWVRVLLRVAVLVRVMVEVLVGVAVGIIGITTKTGALRLVVVPSPSCPWLLRPQQYASLAVVMAQVCSPPALILLKRMPLGNVDAMGILLFTCVPFPSCPEELSPQQ